MKKHERQDTMCSIQAAAAALVTAFAWAFPSLVFSAPTVLSDTPIANTTSVQVKPNIMLLMDTSNSMKFSHMPDEIEVGAHQAPTDPFPIGYKSYQCNILYYKPTQTYLLPKNSTGADLPLPAFNAAFYDVFGPTEYRENPARSPSLLVDLSTSFRAYDTSTRQFATVSDPAQPAYYYVYTSGTGAEPSSLNFAGAPCTDIDTGTSATATIPASSGGTWTRVLVSSLDADGQRNFAIWYSYYRTRISMIKSAVSLSFTPLTDSYRAGLITVKPYASNVPTLGTPVGSDYYLALGDFGGTQRQNWFGKLFSQVPGGSSPAREGLARVGRHYAGKQDSINQGMSGDPVQYSCQQNFTIMTTDGYWNTAAETAGPVGLDGVSLIGQQDGLLDKTVPDPNSAIATINIIPRPIWDGYPDTTRVKTEKLLEYVQEDCSSLYGPLSTLQNLQSTQQNLQSTAQIRQSTLQNLQSTEQNLRSTNQNLQSTTQIREGTIQILQSTAQRLRSTTQNLQNTTQNLQSTTQVQRSTVQNLRSTVQNLQDTSQLLQTTSQITTRTEQITRSTVQNLRSTNQNRQSTTQTLQGTVQNLQSTAQRLRSTSQTVQSTTQTRQSTLQTRISTEQKLQSTEQKLQSTAQNRQSTTQNRQSTTQNLRTTVQNLRQTVQIKQSTSQWFSYDSTTELSTPVASCTNGGTITCTHNVTTNVPVASCTAQTAQAANLYKEITCSTTYSPVAPEAVASCTPVAASAGNSWTATVCTTNNTTDVPVASCTASAASAGNSWTTTTCSTNNTTNVPVASCSASGPTAGNGYTTTTCPAPVTTGPTAVETCSPITADAGNAWTTTTCSTNNTTNVPVGSCTPQTAAAGNSWTTITCPAAVVTTNVPVASCTAAAASAGNSWTTTTCPAPITTGPTPAASCTAAAASAGNSYTTTTCPNISTGPTAVETCTPVTASAGNSWTATTCTPNNTTNVPVSSCTASAASAGNAWTTTTCPAPITTGPTPVSSCTPDAASGGNSWTTRTCADNNTTSVPVASCTPQTAAAGNSWTTITCPAPVTTGPTAVSSCTTVAASAGNSWTATTCTPNNTTNVFVETCTASAANAGNAWTTTTCPAPVVTTNVPVASCTASAANAGNSWTTTTCSTNNTTNVPVASCTVQTAAAGNSWTTITCTGPTILSGPTVTGSCTPVAASAGNGYVATVCGAITDTIPVQTCTPQTANAGNGWTTITCATSNTTNVPVATCTPQTAAAGNGWTTITCPPPNVTTNVPVASCTASGPNAGNFYTTTTCPAPVTTGPTPVASCTAAAANAGNTWTTTTCTPNNTSNVPVASCTASTANVGNNWTTTTCSNNNTSNIPVAACTATAADAGNNWTTTTCPAPVVTTNVPVASCTAAAANGGNSYTTTTCADNNTTNVPVAGCTTQTAAVGNAWTTITCPAPVTTGPTPVSACTTVAASAGNSWTATTCTPNNTTNVPVGTCTASVADAGNNWTTTTCPAPVVTTNVPVAACSASAANGGNSWTTTACSTNNTTNVPVSGCTASAANAGNGWTTTTCPAPVTTGPTPVSSCTAVAASAGNSWTATSCTPNNTTNVPVGSCTPQTADAGNSWITITCPAPVVTTNVPVATCTAAAAGPGNSYTTTTCPPPVTTSTPEVYNCVPIAASAANSWTSTLCDPTLPGKELKSRVGTRVTTDILSGTTLITSTVSNLDWNPASGYSVTDGQCVPVGSTLVAGPVLPPDGPATTAQILPPAVPADVVGPPSTAYSQTCPGNAWPCTLEKVVSAGSYNSLADVAQYYYVTDLRTGAAWDSNLAADPPTKNDNVPASSTGPEDDRVPWQHMTTYTIALGVSGTVNYSKKYKDDLVGDFADLRSGAKAWPIWPDSSLDYVNNGALYSNPKSIDDFWHTAVNGRGRYFSAGNPADVVDGLRAVLNDLGKKQGSGAAAAASSQAPVQGNNIAYVAKYATTTWSGDIEAREIDLTTGAVLSPVLWSAQTKLDARAGYFCDDRKILLFRSGATNNLVDFKWNSGTCSTETIPESTTVTVTAGTVTSVSLDTVTYSDPNNPPTAKAQTGALVPRDLKVGDAVLANDVVTTSAGAVVKIEHIDSPTTVLNGAEQAHFGSAKVALLSQYPDLSDGTNGNPNQRAIADDDNLVNFIRGHRGREGFVAKDPVKLYRKRDSILGDFVSAQPVFVKAPFASYTDTGYQTFKSAQANRKSMIYAAANDGMLHAFYGGVVSVSGDPPVTSIDSTGGQEAWAFMPSSVLGNLYKLADFDYANRHTFLVDGTPSIGDVYDSVAAAWKTVLVAGLNKGGKTYYALDVTDPDAPKALWEFNWSATCYDKLVTTTHGADCDLGYTFGKPVITKLKDGTWVALVTSGYNNVSGSSGDGRGFLYVLNVMTGKIISKIDTGFGDATTPSGLAQITNFVDNALVNNTTKYVYAGDNSGNVFRFDVYDDPATTGADEAAAVRIGVTLDSAGVPQPITTRPELGEIGGKPWIFVGTGRLLGLPDLTDVRTQSVYGFIDPMGVYTTDLPDPLAGTGGLRDVLRPLAISPKTASNANPAVGATRTVACTGTTGATGTCARKSGWVVDLPDDGERINVDMSLVLGTLVFASNVPRNTACNIGGYSWLNFLDFRTGLAVAGSTSVSAYLGESLAVGLSILRLPSIVPGGQGRIVASVMGSGGVPQNVNPPVNVPPPIGRRVSWRELLQ